MKHLRYGKKQLKKAIIVVYGFFQDRLLHGQYIYDN